jgi:hypothetical protein
MILAVSTIVLLMVSGGLFSQKKIYSIATEAGYVIAMAVIMTICQSVFWMQRSGQPYCAHGKSGLGRNHNSLR